mmetsp:Transcript_70431/g.190453  ORF Transcript_70431/g.190453 Transcript_70431/m.190453 type:complete len:305 (+) Transcript_70431:54-968(+)
MWAPARAAGPRGQAPTRARCSTHAGEAPSLPRRAQCGRALLARRLRRLPPRGALGGGSCRRRTLGGGLLDRGRVALGAEHACDPGVAQALQAAHVEVQGLVRRLRDGQHGGVAPLTHGELEALGLQSLAVLLPPHEADSHLADGVERVIVREGPPRGVAQLEGEVGHHPVPHRVGAADAARVGAHPHDLAVEPGAAQLDTLDEQPAGPHTVGVQITTQLEGGRLLFVVRQTEQSVLRGCPDVVAFATQAAHVRVVLHARMIGACRRRRRRRRARRRRCRTHRRCLARRGAVGLNAVHAILQCHG